MPNIEPHICTVGGVEYITVCDVHNAYRQTPVAKKDCHKTAFVNSKGKYVFNALPLGSALQFGALREEVARKRQGALSWKVW